jgi:hypothetical protein
VIGKITKLASFRTLASYLLRGGRGQVLSGCPMVGRTVGELTEEADSYLRLNPKLRKAVAHFSLSPSPDDPPLSEHQWQAIAHRFMEEMGFGEAAWTAVLHRDSRVPHIHIAACRLTMKGKTITDSNDFRRAEKAIRGIEKTFGLAVVAGPHSKTPKAAQRRPRQPDHMAARRAAAKRKPTKEDAMRRIDNKISSVPMPDFDAVLAEFHDTSREHPGAAVADALTDRQRKAIRRQVVDEDYGPKLVGDLEPQPYFIWRSKVGPILCFRDGGQIADAGDRLTALGAMDDEKAAKRIVALAVHPSRGWKSISFTGSARFLDLAMREALDKHLAIHTTSAAQAAILAKIMAERAGSMGSAVAPLPTGAVPAGSDLDSIPVLDDMGPSEPERRSQVVGPLFRNFRERLQDRRERSKSEVPQPQPQTPTKPPKPFGR